MQSNACCTQQQQQQQQHPFRPLTPRWLRSPLAPTRILSGRPAVSFERNAICFPITSILRFMTRK